MRSKKILPGVVTLSLCLLAALPARALAWGPAGHSIVARIAGRQLLKDENGKALNVAVNNILRNDTFFKQNCKGLKTLDEKLACVASWADSVRPARPETGPLHFVNIPRGVTSYDAARDCKKGACVIEGVRKYQAVLADRQQKASRRSEALKFIVHFVGDMHQPLHDADDKDLGGNEKHVRWFGEKSPACNNVHKVWDSEIIRRAGFSDAGYTDSLLKGLGDAAAADFVQGDLVSWAEAAHGLAVGNAYDLLPAQDQNDALCKVKVNKETRCLAWGTAGCKNQPRLFRYALGQSYYDRNRAVVEGQLRRGGVRLAAVLKEALEKAMSSQ